MKKPICKMNKKELQEAMREAEYKERQLVGFIKTIQCWDLFMKTEEGEGIRLDELREAINSIKCPHCEDCSCGEE